MVWGQHLRSTHVYQSKNQIWKGQAFRHCFESAQPVTGVPRSNPVWLEKWANMSQYSWQGDWYSNLFLWIGPGSLLNKDQLIIVDQPECHVQNMGLQSPCCNTIRVCWVCMSYPCILQFRQVNHHLPYAPPAVSPRLSSCPWCLTLEQDKWDMEQRFWGKSVNCNIVWITWKILEIV